MFKRSQPQQQTVEIRTKDTTFERIIIDVKDINKYNVGAFVDFYNDSNNFRGNILTHENVSLEILKKLDEEVERIQSRKFSCNFLIVCDSNPKNHGQKAKFEEKIVRGIFKTIMEMCYNQCLESVVFNCQSIDNAFPSKLLNFNTNIYELMIQEIKNFMEDQQMYYRWNGKVYINCTSQQKVNLEERKKNALGIIEQTKQRVDMKEEKNSLKNALVNMGNENRSKEYLEEKKNQGFDIPTNDNFSKAEMNIVGLETSLNILEAMTKYYDSL